MTSLFVLSFVLVATTLLLSSALSLGLLMPALDMCILFARFFGHFRCLSSWQEPPEHFGGWCDRTEWVQFGRRKPSRYWVLRFETAGFGFRVQALAQLLAVYGLLCKPISGMNGAL